LELSGRTFRPGLRKRWSSRARQPDDRGLGLCEAIGSGGRREVWPEWRHRVDVLPVAGSAKAADADNRQHTGEDRAPADPFWLPHDPAPAHLTRVLLHRYTGEADPCHTQRAPAAWGCPRLSACPLTRPGGGGRLRAARR